jgi:hypothetical protein
MFTVSLPCTGHIVSWKQHIARQETCNLHWSRHSCHVFFASVINYKLSLLITPKSKDSFFAAIILKLYILQKHYFNKRCLFLHNVTATSQYHVSIMFFVTDFRRIKCMAIQSGPHSIMFIWKFIKICLCLSVGSPDEVWTDRQT